MSLQFNSHATSQDLVSEVLKICGATTSVYPVVDITRRINSALDRFSYLATVASGTWQFDASDYTDLPIGTANIVSAQQDYSFASDVLTVEKVMVKDSGGLWHELEAVDISDKNEADHIWTLPTGNSGVPTRYETFASSLLLDPIPNYNSTGGLKVVFRRAITHFASTATTDTAGIPSIFDMYLCRYAALPFLIEKSLPQTSGIAQQIQIDEQAIKDFFSFRSHTKDTKPSLRPNIEDTK